MSKRESSGEEQKAAPKKQKGEGPACAAGMAVDEEAFLELLEKMMVHSEKVQNNPPALIPQEDLIADEVMRFLKPYSEPAGPLQVKKCTYVNGRSNLIITYPATKPTQKVVSFVGSHMDVVAAERNDWERDPFKLIREGNHLYGRGVTDCLGHVALLTVVLSQLAKEKIPLDVNVTCVFIANEESGGTLGVGIDKLDDNGELSMLKNGPLYWVDSANFGPTMGTAGVQGWSVTITGKKFHSGIPSQAINPVNVAAHLIPYLQKRFYKKFPSHVDSKKYSFVCPSSLKPTRINSPAGSLNQIPLTCTVEGDIRFTPFYDLGDIKEAVQEYIKDFNELLPGLEQFGPSPYTLPEEELKANVELEWLGEGMKGVACDLSSKSYQAMVTAMENVRKGRSEPFSITGSLPLIAEYKERGYDLNIIGFGKMSAYHACNEFGLLSDFLDGGASIFNVIDILNKGY